MKDWLIISPRVQRFLLFFALSIGFDQLLKGIARGQGSVILNPGVSFGWGSTGSVWIFGLLTLVVLWMMFYFFQKIWRKNMEVFGILAGAAISNVLDRLWWGGVQDFLPVPFLHIQNNLADWLIFGCMVWVFFQMFREKKWSEDGV